jgi:hypothetical protein
MGKVENRASGRGLGKLKKMIENERYCCNQGEERNPIG